MLTSRVRSAVLVGLVVVTLSGCTVSPQADDGFDQLESTIASWQGVADVSVGGAFNGLPTSRTLSVDVTLKDAANVDLADYLDRTLSVAWSYDVYQPSGVSVSFVDGKQPVPDGMIPPTIDLADPAAELGLPEGVVHRHVLSVSSEQMTERYGQWPAPSSKTESGA